MPDVQRRGAAGFRAGPFDAGIDQGPDCQASSPTSGSLLAAAVAMVGFVMSSRHHPAPMVEPTPLRIQSFVAAPLIAVQRRLLRSFADARCSSTTSGVTRWRLAWLSPPPRWSPPSSRSWPRRRPARPPLHRRHRRVDLGRQPAVVFKVVGSQPDFGEWPPPARYCKESGWGATFLLLGAALARLARRQLRHRFGGDRVRQVGAIIGVAVLVILVGTLAPQPKRCHGCALAAICFLWRWGSGAVAGRIQSQLRLNHSPPGGSASAAAADPHRWLHLRRGSDPQDSCEVNLLDEAAHENETSHSRCA